VYVYITHAHTQIDTHTRNACHPSHETAHCWHSAGEEHGDGVVVTGAAAGVEVRAAAAAAGGVVGVVRGDMGKGCVVVVELCAILVLIVGVVVVACELVGHTEVAHISFFAQSSISCP